MCSADELKRDFKRLIRENAHNNGMLKLEHRVPAYKGMPWSKHKYNMASKQTLTQRQLHFLDFIQPREEIKHEDPFLSSAL